MQPSFLVGASAFRRISAELDRVFPAEGVVLPLVGLTRRDETSSPCAPLALLQIREVIVAAAVLVPSASQVNEPARVSVRANTDDPVNAAARRLLRRHPGLRACGYLHSHPFARGRTSPSRGLRGDYEGHMLPLRERNRACNLDTSFSFIACRAAREPRWVLQGFALEPAGEVVDLGLARVVADSSETMQRCLLPPLGRRCPQRQLLRRWRGALKRAGLRFHDDELFDGWTRTVVEIDDRHLAVVLLPLGFPAESPQLYAVRRNTGGRSTSRRLDGPIPLDPQAWIAPLQRVKEVFDESA